MSLFSMETAPVPLDAETYIGEKREYTQMILETELIALTEIIISFNAGTNIVMCYDRLHVLL